LPEAGDYINIKFFFTWTTYQLAFDNGASLAQIIGLHARQPMHSNQVVLQSKGNNYFQNSSRRSFYII